MSAEDPTWIKLHIEYERAQKNLQAEVRRFRINGGLFSKHLLKVAERQWRRARTNLNSYSRSKERRKFIAKFSDKRVGGRRMKTSHRVSTKQPVYLVVGIPGSGKSWVCEQLAEEFSYARHDDFIKAHDTYLEAIVHTASTSKKPVLAEAPFSITQTKDPLEAQGFEVIPVFILEEPGVVAQRYENDPKRDGSPLPAGHVSRLRTYAQRAQEWGSFSGTADEVLEFLKSVGGNR